MYINKLYHRTSFLLVSVSVVLASSLLLVLVGEMKHFILDYYDERIAKLTRDNGGDNKLVDFGKNDETESCIVLTDKDLQERRAFCLLFDKHVGQFF